MRTALAVFTMVVSLALPFRAAAVISPLDFGDAPDPTYPTLQASNGASHVASGPMLGTARDAEPDGQPSIAADGDDVNDTDDEDGVVFTSPYAPGATVSVEVTASGSGLLNAWVDFNMDGDWMDAGEQVFTDTPLVAGVNSLVFSVPSGAVAGTVPFARFRLDSIGGLTPYGQALDGEVEDHRVVETDTGGGGGGGGGCGTLAPPGGGKGPSGLLPLAAVSLTLWALRRRWLVKGRA